MLPEPNLFEEIAVALGVAPAFIEKDWYAIQVLAAIATVRHECIVPVFCGGTCLSKAHAILKRFSEDLDFRARFLTEQVPPKNVRRRFRASVLDAVETAGGVELERSQIKSGGNYFKFPINYKRMFAMPGGLRTHLQVEFSYTQPKTDIEQRPIKSFVAEFSRTEAEVNIGCLAPVETAADKLCALTWRVIKRDRHCDGDDPAMIRHLHDLAALHPFIMAQSRDFIKMARTAFAIDLQSGPRAMNHDLAMAAGQALEILHDDSLYADEYKYLVMNMSYARDNEKLDFSNALDRLKKIISLL